MNRAVRIFAGMVLGLAAVFAVLTLVAPRETVSRPAPFSGDLSDPAAYLAARESAFDDIVPGTEARVVWAAGGDQRTPLSVLYLHGFSATSEEIRPVPDAVADTLGANLVFARLRGHGRTGQALADATADEWLIDTAEALAIARAVGDEVLIIGTSTGATMAAIAVTEPAMAEAVVGVVMVAPNFYLANSASVLLEWPWAQLWLPIIAGAERHWEAVNPDHDRYWTNSYPTVAVLSMIAAMREARARDFSAVEVPLLVLYGEEDQVISGAKAVSEMESWGGPMRVQVMDLPETGVDPYAHVIAGDILSPAMTGPVTSEILEWTEAFIRTP